MKRTRYPWSVWMWTGAEENLFHLNPLERRTFVLMTREANR